jgi:hypothetical protein
MVSHKNSVEMHISVVQSSVDSEIILEKLNEKFEYLRNSPTKIIDTPATCSL